MVLKNTTSLDTPTLSLLGFVLSFSNETVYIYHMLHYSIFAFF